MDCNAAAAAPELSEHWRWRIDMIPRLTLAAGDLQATALIHPGLSALSAFLPFLEVLVHRWTSRSFDAGFLYKRSALQYWPSGPVVEYRGKSASFKPRLVSDRQPCHEAFLELCRVSS